MAAEVPVTDVLCEAMEYLCKLGTNLRTRSESLKEKRICKSKLRNSHAVQKAANKVLLICQLSKKSLENVESGVRKVLSLVNATQSATSDGGKPTLKSPQSCGSSDYSNFKHFDYGSRRLHVLKKVPLKHYMSVKVLAKSMPLSMQEEYPVFYDCALFRMRKKNNELHNMAGRTKKKLRNLSGSDCNDHNESIKYAGINNEKEDQPKREDPLHRSQINIENPASNSDSNGNSMGTSDITIEEKECNSQTDTEQDPVENIKEADGKVVIKKEKEKSNLHLQSSKESCKIKHRKRIRIYDDNSDSSTVSTAKQNPTEPVERERKNSASDSESSDKGHELKKQKLYGADTEMFRESHNKECNNDNDTNDTEEINEKLEDNSKNDKSDEMPFIKCVSLNKLLKPEVLGDNNSAFNKKHSKIPEIKSSVGHKGHNKEVNNLDASRKNIDKKIYIDKNKSKKIKEKSKLSADDQKFIRENNASKKDRDENADNQSSDAEFWKQKREEVKAFKSRELEIYLTRLPKFSVKFLHVHKLKRIIQNNSIIFEESHQMTANDECHTKQKNDAPESDIDQNNKVKHALLNDSDSDVETNKSHETTDLVKNSGSALSPDIPNNCKSVFDALIYEMDASENITNQIENITEVTDKIKNALLNDSDSDKNELKNTEDSNVHCVQDAELNVELTNLKNKLLNSDSDADTQTRCDKNTEVSQNVDSECSDIYKDNHQSEDSHHNNVSDIGNKSSKESTEPNKDVEPVGENITPKSSDHDASRTPLSKRRKHNHTVTPMSKRKHIMESMHAKKMLLNYSSSDTEDEQLSNALMEIKKALLKGVSSDEENAAQENIQVQRNPVTSSSSSTSSNDDISGILKKRKELNGYNPTGSNSESENCKGDAQTCNKQNDENTDENSISSGSKMVRSKAKPGNSSSQKSDNGDSSDKDIDRLTNINNLNSHNQHVSTPEPTRTSRRKDKPTKALLGEELLKAESSDAASMADSDVDHEELPVVQMPSLNGSGIEHLAKDDLLGESDSSESHEKDKSSEELQNTEETDEENVKSRRRKALAISSDSEVGSSRRKEVKSSDFEESEDDGSETGKKTKRRRKDTESDASGSSSNDGSKKKRRRIKQVNDSDLSGSDTENEGRNKHGRKNIRKVMGKNQLEEATKKAAREEKERIARISERQKLYNNLEFDESGKPDEVVLEKVVLDFDPVTKEPLVEVDRGLVKKLKPHQANGIKFMWDACFESVKRMKKDKGSGCILAHCMGLGKTLQVVSLTHTLLTHGSLTGVNRVLVVCPLSTVLNWVNEFNMWLRHAQTDNDVDVYELSRFKQNSERAFQLHQWFTHGGVCVLGYEMFRNLSADNTKKYKKKMLRNFQEALVDPGPDLVVCDEGHLLKNEKTSLSQSMNRVKTRRRIVLTGTPLQNNLKEYYCMVQFVKPNLLGKYNEYLNRFVNPITNGQYTDSTEQDIRVMKRRSHVLHKMLDGAVQRRDYGVLAPFLPPKHEYVLFITLSEVQVTLYQFYLDNYSRRPLPGKSSGFLFPDFQSLQRIWTHPLVLKYNSERYEIMQQKKREREEEDSEGSLVDFINDDSTPDESSSEETTESDSDMSDDSRKKSKKKKSAKKAKAKDTRGSRRGTRANPDVDRTIGVPVELEDMEDVAEIVEVKTDNPTEWWIPLVTDEVLEDMRNSHKLVLLFDILKHCEAIGDKLLVFSQSLYSLDLIEHFLGKVDEATQEGRIDDKLGGHVGSWSPGVDYFRLDGSTSCENRSIWCKHFNREDNPRARLFLISTRAGGLGINLVAANRVVIFDVSWNPSHDVQSIFRVYRFGQKKPCYVYRFLAMGTMEEKIYERQVTKQAISKRVIDEQQIDRHYAENDLAELYKFEPQPPSPRPLPPLPKDRLFAEMLKEHEAQIYKYHEHDSLLENKEEETLSEEERKAAWEDFENEKTRPPPQPFPSPWPMHNGLVPGLVAQQQQQLAYATLAAMLKKDVPNISDNQIRDMLPLIYNSNPGLMQKLSEIYKYPQAAMMNPAMMNPAMNSGAVGGGVSVGGASGLQYEPPWQRQLQQQQQMRLQQLMQQQQNMGAKFYAGGLGSRDPVAMALQQQRAREIMVSGAGAGAGAGAGRPRGRPPLQPRLPAAPQDVVNLDSD